MKLKLLIPGLALQADEPTSRQSGIKQLFLNGKPQPEGMKEIGG